jgi:hypothetical protein
MCQRREMHTKFWYENLTEEITWKKKMEVGRIILKNRIGGCGQIQVAGFYIRSNESSDVIKCWKVLD